MTKSDPRKIMVSSPVEASSDEPSSVEVSHNTDEKLLHEKVISPISKKLSDESLAQKEVEKPEPLEIDGLPGEIKFTEDTEAEKTTEEKPIQAIEPIKEDVADEPEVDEATKSEVDIDLADNDEVDQTINPESDTAVPGEESEVGLGEDELANEPELEPGFEPSWRKHQDVPNRKKSKTKILKWTLAILLIGIIAALAYPTSRYYILQKSSIKKSFEIKFTDEKTGQPVSNVQVSINGNQQATDENGHAYFSNIGLGKYNLVASRPGFAPVSQIVILEPWTSYNLPTKTLQVIGVRFQLQVTDWLSGQSVSGVEAKYISSVTKSDQPGKLTVVTPPLKSGKAQVVVSADGYHDQTVTLQAIKTDINPIKLVPVSLDYFISNRDGKYGIYSSWLDGSHQTQILSGTGNEKAGNTQFFIAPSNKYAALVTTRNNIQDPQYASQTINELFIINLQNSQLTKITNGPVISVGWVNDDFIYQVTDTKKSYKAKDAAKLISVNSINNKQTTLSISNSFAPSTSIVNGQIYYSPNDSFNNSSQAFFTKIYPDGTGKQQLLTDKIINQISRLSYTQLQLQGQEGDVVNYETTSNKSVNATSSNTNNIYTKNPNNQSYAWVEQRDGKAALIIKIGDKQKVLYQAVGITNPLHWLDSNTIVFTVNNDSGVSDYVLSINGGKAQKISDVSNLGVY